MRIVNKNNLKTAFRIKYGAYKSIVMIFGMMNAPSIFVMLMNAIYRPLIGKPNVIYLNNIIV